MIKYKKEKVSYETETETFYCDICQKKLGDGEEERVTIEAITNYSNFGQDGGYKIGYGYDFCLKCFEKEILPFLKQKSNPREIDIDW